MIRLAGLVLAASQFWLAPIVLAHGDWPPKHGGIVSDGETSFELVANVRAAVLHVEDHGEPVSTQGAKGVLAISRGAQTWNVAVAEAGGNRLKCSLPTPLAPGDRVFVRITMGNGSIAAGRYVIK